MDIQIFFGDFIATDCEAIATSNAGRRALGDLFGRIAGVEPTSAVMRKSQVDRVAKELRGLGATVEVV